MFTQTLFKSLCLPEFPCNRALHPLPYPVFSPHFTRSLTSKVLLGDTTGTQMSWGLLRPTPKGWGLYAGTIQGDPISVPRASWTQKGTAFTLLVANIPQHQPLSLPWPQTQSDTPNWRCRMRPLITDEPLLTDRHMTVETT